MSRRGFSMALACASALTIVACRETAPTGVDRPSVGSLAAAKGSSGGGTTPAPAPAAPMTGVWTGENRWGPGVTEARRWTLTLTQSGTTFSGRLVTEQTSITGSIAESEGNIQVFGTLTGSAVTFTMRPKRGGSASTFVGTLSADGKSMTGVNNVPTVPASTLGGPFTLTKQ